MAEKLVKVIFHDHSVNKKVVDNVENYLYMKFEPKLMQHSEENGQNPNFQKIAYKRNSDFSAEIRFHHFFTFTTG